MLYRLMFAGVFCVSLALVATSLVIAQDSQPKAADDFQTNFPLEKDELSATGSNPYFILEPGYVMVYEKGKGKNKVVHKVTVLDETKKVGDIETRVVVETETKGGVLEESSRNFFAISKKTKNVYYFGEEVDIYKDGKVDNHEGAWLHGVNGAKFGMIMPGKAAVKAKYYHEQAPKVAADRAEIVSFGETVKTPAGTFKDCIKVEETSAIETALKEYKFYAPGVGLVVDADGAKLVKYGKDKK